MKWFGIMAGLVLAGAAPGAVSAQAAALPVPACPGSAVLPPDLAGWNSRMPLVAAREAAGLSAATLTPGVAVDATLRRSGEIRYPTAPRKPGDTASYGGLFAFAVPQAGSYRIALGAGAWIDVIGDGKVVGSTGHGHGPDCSGVRKMVDFLLTPGRYTLQVSGSPDAMLPLMIVRLR